MERVLYSSFLSGVGLDGQSFFYANPLAVYPDAHRGRLGDFGGDHTSATRQRWFSTACCPPNIARLLASFGKYAYSHDDRTAYVHLYVGSRAELDIRGQTIVLEQKTAYPWKEAVRITVQPENPLEFTLALRIPGWCQNAKIALNGKPVGAAAVVRKGYAHIRRRWQKGDRVDMTLPMPIERIQAHPRVRMNCGKVALQRGPVVYCLEEIDNGPDLADITLPRSTKLRAKVDRALFGGVPVITGRAYRRDVAGWRNRLYQPAQSGKKLVNIKAVPYCLWSNRGSGEMLVWIWKADG